MNKGPANNVLILQVIIVAVDHHRRRLVRDRMDRRALGVPGATRAALDYRLWVSALSALAPLSVVVCV